MTRGKRCKKKKRRKRIPNMNGFMRMKKDSMMENSYKKTQMKVISV